VQGADSRQEWRNEGRWSGSAVGGQCPSQDKASRIAMRDTCSECPFQALRLFQ